MERLDQDHPGQPFHEGEGRVEPSEEQEVHHAAPSQDQLEGDGADERRDYQRKEPEDRKQPPPRKVVADGEVGEGEAEESAEEYHEEPREERAAESLSKERAIEKAEEVTEGPSVSAGDGDPEDPDERIEDENDQEGEEAGHDDGLSPLDPPAGRGGHGDGAAQGAGRFGSVNGRGRRPAPPALARGRSWSSRSRPTQSRPST